MQGCLYNLSFVDQRTNDHRAMHAAGNLACTPEEDISRERRTADQGRHPVRSMICKPIDGQKSQRQTSYCTLFEGRAAKYKAISCRQAGTSLRGTTQSMHILHQTAALKTQTSSTGSSKWSKYPVNGPKLHGNLQSFILCQARHVKRRS